MLKSHIDGFFFSEIYDFRWIGMVKCVLYKIVGRPINYALQIIFSFPNFLLQLLSGSVFWPYHI